MSNPTRDEQQQEDIDSVPILAVVQATLSREADDLWDRALGYERAVHMDPDFATANRREVYTEIGRRLEEHLGSDLDRWLPPETDDRSKETDLLQLSNDQLEAALSQAADRGQLDQLLEKALEGQ